MISDEVDIVQLLSSTVQRFEYSIGIFRNRDVQHADLHVVREEIKKTPCFNQSQADDKDLDCVPSRCQLAVRTYVVASNELCEPGPILARWSNTWWIPRGVVKIRRCALGPVEQKPQGPLLSR